MDACLPSIANAPVAQLVERRPRRSCASMRPQHSHVRVQHKFAGWVRFSPGVPLSLQSLPGGMVYALRSERSVLATSRFEPGGRDQHLRGRGEKGRRGPKTLSVGPAEKATQVNEQRPTVADAPNGYFSGSLGKRVSKPMLSSSNDRSSANCRFESCRPHQLS